MPTVTKGYGIDASIVTAPKAGRISLVTQTMLSIIAGADSTLQPQDTHVSPNWKTAINKLIEDYPIVTLRVGSENVMEKIYGRQLTKTLRGHYVMFAFSAHVWGEKYWQLFDDVDHEAENVPQAKLASDLADKIIDTLTTYIGDATSGIAYFDRMIVRESEPDRGPQRLTRFIIEGYVLVKRPQ